VFVHDNLAVLTSVVLGLKILIRPMQWCYMLVPILPTVLIESLELPQPLLVGITTRDYALNVMTSLSEKERKTKTWIIMDPSYY
jgi:DENN (AEX-3) domain